VVDIGPYDGVAITVGVIPQDLSAWQVGLTVNALWCDDWLRNSRCNRFGA